MKILVVEDEDALSDTICDYLRSGGFVCEKAATYASAEDKILEHAYDLVILDVTLPDGNGLRLLETIKRESGNTGVLIVSAKSSLDDKLKGLELGADDYLSKPFHLAELNARVTAINRRRAFEGQKLVHMGSHVIDTASRQVTKEGRLLDLTRMEFNLLLYFVINKHKVLTKDAIADHLCGDATDMTDNFDFLYTHIRNLRKKLGDDAELIQTVYGVGYKLKTS